MSGLHRKFSHFLLQVEKKRKFFFHPCQNTWKKPLRHRRDELQEPSYTLGSSVVRGTYNAYHLACSVSSARTQFFYIF